MNQKSEKRFWFARWIEIFFFLICNSIWQIILFLILIYFDSQLIWIFIHFDLRFNFILFILIRFDFDRRESRFKPESWFTCESKFKSNQKSKVGESWFTYCRIIGWFDIKLNANQSESRIKLLWALVCERKLKNLEFHSKINYSYIKHRLKTRKKTVSMEDFDN